MDYGYVHVRLRTWKGKKEKNDRKKYIERWVVWGLAFWLSKGSFCVCERNRRVMGKRERLGNQD